MDGKTISQLNPAEIQAYLKAYMHSDHGFYMGGYIVGFLFDAIMLGLIVNQFLEWWAFSRDEESRPVRYLVYFSMLFSSGITVFLTVWVFHMFVHGFGNYTVFVQYQWVSWWFFFEGVIRVPVQAYFAERAWRMLNKSWLFAGIMISLFIAALGLGVGVKLVIVQPELRGLAQLLILIWLAVEIVSDIVVSGSIAYRLWRSRTGWKGTDRIITRLIRLILETQTPPTVVAILFLIFWLVENKGSSTRAFICSPKVYVVCLFSVLNSRQSLRKDLSVHQAYEGKSHAKSGARGARSEIQVTTETFTHVARGSIPTPERSARSMPRVYQLEPVVSKNTTGSNDRDFDDAEAGDHVSELGYGSSAVRLTGDDK